MKKVVYIILAVFLLSAGGFLGYFYLIKGKPKNVPKKQVAANSKSLAGSSPLSYRINDEVETEDEYDDDEDYDDEYEYPIFEGNYFEDVESTEAYHNYLAVIEQYKSTGTLDFLWNSTPDQTSDSIVAAINYADENDLVNDFKDFNGYAWPDFIYHGTFVNEDDAIKSDVQIIPVSIREYTPEESAVNASQYKTLIEFLSKGRQTIDYYALYTMYKPLIRRVITQKQYEERYSYWVKNLIVAYQDFENHEDWYERIESVMNEEWLSHVRDVQQLDPGWNSSTWHDDFFSYFEEILPQSSMKPFMDKKKKINTSALVWTYSFWVRRYNEGNTENIIKTLRSIQQDYGL